MAKKKDEFLDAVTARAMHDLDMRRVLRESGIDPSGSAKELRSRLDSLSLDQRTELQERSTLLEEASGRPNDLYYALGELASVSWAERTKGLQDQAEALLTNEMEHARSALSANDVDRFDKIRSEVESVSEAVMAGDRDARRDVRKELRSYFQDQGISIPTERRRIIVDQISDMLPLSPEIAQVRQAPAMLTQARMDHDRRMEAMREQTPANEMKATPTLTR
tara:strand:- start:18735 stop:19400 length:666 start_codon:yes stop_codon:yes gene_type:complete